METCSLVSSDKNGVARGRQGEDGKWSAECDVPQGSTSTTAQARHHRVNALISRMLVRRCIEKFAFVVKYR